MINIHINVLYFIQIASLCLMFMFFFPKREKKVFLFFKVSKTNYIKDHMAVTKNYKKQKGFSKF